MTEEADRPALCPLRDRCTPLVTLGEITASPGESWNCWGRMDRPATFVYDGVEHTNDLNMCSYTPLKGVIRFQENADDWRALANRYLRAIDKLA